MKRFVTNIVISDSFKSLTAVFQLNYVSPTYIKYGNSITYNSLNII